MDTTTIVLKAAGACEIKLGWLTQVCSGFEALARELEKRLRPKLKKGQGILWILNYYLDEDSPEKECLPYPSVGCKVFIVDRGGKRSKPFDEILALGRGPMIFGGSGHHVYDQDAIAKEAAESLLG
jgi:hypothetical protein